MKSTRLIVNADDFGLSRGISDGVIHAHRFGFLTSASLMAGMPASDYAVAQLRQTPALGVGVHLNICTGRPVMPARDVPSLVDASGQFHSPGSMARKLWLWEAAPKEIEAEFRAQIRWIKARGIKPTHADSHHHTHIYPAAVRPFLRALEAEGIQQTRSPRCTVWPKNGPIGGPHEGSLFRRAFVKAYRGALQVTFVRKLRVPDGRISFFSQDRKDPALVGARWRSTIENLPRGTFELACHPAHFEQGFSEFDRIRRQREEELYWLTNHELKDLIRRRGIQLITYKDLTESPITDEERTGVRP